MKGKERTRTRAEGVAATSAGGMKKKKGKPLATSGLGAMGPKAPFRPEMVRAGDLADNPANWRRHPAGQVSAIRAIIRDPPEEFVPVIVGSWTEEGEWVLIGIPTLRFYEVNDLVERLSAVQGATVGISVTDEKRQD